MFLVCGLFGFSTNDKDLETGRSYFSYIALFLEIGRILADRKTSVERACPLKYARWKSPPGCWHTCQSLRHENAVLAHRAALRLVVAISQEHAQERESLPHTSPHALRHHRLRAAPRRALQI